MPRMLLILLAGACCLSPARSQSATETILYSFLGNADGAIPVGLTPGPANSFYGATYEGGAYSYGTIFQLSNHGGAWRKTTLVSFDGTNGGYPYTPLVGKDGALYGFTSDDGGLLGSAYRISQTHGVWTVQSFHFNQSLYNVYGAILTPEGNLIGMAQFGSAIFALQTPGNGGWKLKTLLTLPSGFTPVSLIADFPNNTLYGTFSLPNQPYTGIVYKLSCPGETCSGTRIFEFRNRDTGLPLLAHLDAKGNLWGYGTNAGAHECGTVFRLTPEAGSSTWHEDIVWSFGATTADGCFPSGIIPGADGNVAGITYNGGANNLGAMFNLLPSPSGWTESVPYAFGSSATDGSGPAALIQVAPGTYYGVTGSGGSTGAGTIFQITLH